jgi:SAM-dependent methyltransferase
MARTLRLAVAHRRDPLQYSRAVADLLVRYLRSRQVNVSGRLWLDAGSGSGAIPEALERAGARVVALDVQDRRARGAAKTRFVIGSGLMLPFVDGAFQGVSCSNVLEHVPRPADLIDELLRVCAPGGILYLSWTNWWSPFGGHDWSPFHFFGTRLGPKLFTLIRRKPPLCIPGESLFPVHVGTVLRWLRERDVRVVDVAPRYWPSLRFLATLPGIREVVLWNCVILATVRPDGQAPLGQAGHGARRRRRRA